MNTYKAILAAALGLASVSLASATNYIYITGSTACRGAVYNALAAGVGQASAPTAIVYGGSTASSATYMEFVTTVASTPTIIKCAWSGSEAGTLDISSTTQQEYFLLDPGTGSIPANGTVTLPSSGPSTSVPDTSYFQLETVNIALADNSPAVSKNPTTSAQFTPAGVVVPFVLVKNSGAGLAGLGESDYSSFTDVTSDEFKVLASGGDYLALFTGNPNDLSTYVYLAGRDDNSGTRVNTLAITGVGVKTGVQQVILSNGVLTPAAYTDEGQSSGGTLAKSLIDTTSPKVQTDSISSTSGFTVVAYLGLADDATAEGLVGGSSGGPNPPAIRLTYNGRSYSTANVENGVYAIWGYEFIGYKSGSASNITGLVSALANPATGIGDSTYNDGYEIPTADMQVARASFLPLNPPAY
jgi:hypothetical protein